MGQVNRVDSCRLAVERAGDRAAGSVAASDAFFPFADGLQILIDAGVRAVVQPGGSVRDAEVIAAARAGRGDHVPHRRPALLPLTARPIPQSCSPSREMAMTAQILDGKALAATIKAELKERVAALAERGIVPGLGTVLVGDDPGSHSYVAGKHRDCAQVGIASLQVELPAATTAAELQAEIERAERRPGLHRLHRAAAAARAAWTTTGRSGWSTPTRTRTACTRATWAGWCSARTARCPARRGASSSCCAATGSPLAGAEVCVIGRGTTVGRPLGLLLTRKSENATVTLCHTGTVDVAAHTRRADIVIAAAGRPGLVTADMVKPGAVCVDVGITRTAEGLVGDLDASVHEVASWVAPVPGGVGPMTRAMLLSNVVERAERLADR